MQLISSQSICICNALSLDIRLGHIDGHNPSDHHGHISNYSHISHNVFLYYGQAVRLLKKHNICRVTTGTKLVHTEGVPLFVYYFMTV